MLVTDTYLTEVKPIRRQEKASFTAEIDISNAQGEKEIQIEGLMVGSFSSTRPEDDFELYLTTVMDIDPEDKIVSAPLSDICSPSPMLIESCERVASFYTRNAPVRWVCRASKRLVPPAGFRIDPQLNASSWPMESKESLERFITTSPYYLALDFIRRLGENLPDVLAGMLPTVVEEAHQLMGFQRHISRVVRQIAHKYPHMNVLGLTDPELGLTEHALAGLKEAFSTYRVGGEPEKNLSARVLVTQSLRQKVVIDLMDLDEAPEATEPQYDLVLLTTSSVESNKTHHVLQATRRRMRPGAFLILVHISRCPLQDRIRRCAGFNHRDRDISTPPDWPGVLDSCGLQHSVGNSHQFYPPGFSITVRQADSHEKEILLNPLAHIPNSYLTERLLLVGGKQLWTSLISSGVSQALSSYCGSITVAESLEQVNADGIASVTAAILLSDIEEPILATMTTRRMDVLRSLLRPDMTVLWVTHNARAHNPDQAASLGFTRTIAAETPGLFLQVLDLETTDTSPAVKVVSDTFARLAVHYPSTVTPGAQPLWVHEREIHIEDGHRLVPRVLPWKEGNDRVNAPRRIVTNVINTLENRVEVSQSDPEDGPFKYRTEVERINPQCLSKPEAPMIQVDYSTVGVLKLGWAYAAHVCIGRDTQTGKPLVALSKQNASYVASPTTCISNIGQDQLSQPVVLGLVVRYLAALTIAEFVQDRAVLLLEPDSIFQECAKDVLVKRGVWLRVCSTDAARCKLTPGMTSIHPRSSAREIRALYPPAGAWVFNFLPEKHQLTQRLVASLPNNCRYSPRGALLGAEYRDTHEDQSFAEGIWEEAVSLALAKAASWKTEASPPMTTVPTLLESVEPAQPFLILDWKAERSVSHTVKPFIGKDMLRPSKTYVLIGITRDFGQSLCTLFVEQGAQHIVLASRNPPKQHPRWQEELLAKGINIRFEALDVTKLDEVLAFKAKLAGTWPPVGGIVNGAMVLEDRVFSVMSLETLQRVMHPKTIGSKNLDMAFDSPDLDFFVMTSSFAAIGGHAGQSNYAAANMYMNGLAASRRRRGLPASVLNIGVIYGLGFLHREKDNLYEGLAREGYPPISERDIHHMFLEAIAAGKPDAGSIDDLTTGLRRYPANRPTLHWHRDPRFSHFTYVDDDVDIKSTAGDSKKTLKELLTGAESKQELLDVVVSGFTEYLERLLQLPEKSVTGDNSIAELGADSLVAVEIRSWMWKSLAQDVAVMKILGATSITKSKFCCVCRTLDVGIG